MISCRSDFALNNRRYNLVFEPTSDDRIMIDSPRAKQEIDAPTIFMIITML